MSGYGWSNWAGSVTCQPKQMASPADETELRALVAGSSGRVRVRGTGHSFMPVCATDGTLITLGDMEGDFLGQGGDGAAPTARLNAGCSLNSLSRALQDKGLAFRNLGDIDVQTLAGATMTGTHGSGRELRSLSGELTGVKLMTATGEIVTADAAENADLLDAARVSLGALGILLEAEINVRPAFRLRRETVPRRTQDLLADAMSLWQQHRHFEFFALPFSDYSLSIIHQETDEPDRHDHAGDDTKALQQLGMLRTATKYLPWLRRKLMNAIAGSIKPEVKVGHSWQVLASVRETRFHEMEYHLPVEQGLEALAEVLALIERERREVFFPIECRMTAADTGWLSPFHGAPRISVAIHAHQPDDFGWFIERAEPIFRRRGGRPHWGKMHSLKAAELSDLYPEFGRFQSFREELDPEGRFLNPLMSDLFVA
jgi:FAD-linked oxidoreductase